MLAQVIREERFGEPCSAFQIEKIALPKIGHDEVLVRIMAAGVNYNGVFAALGKPVNVIRQRQKWGEALPFHIAGSDGSGIVEQVGPGVRNVRVGDEVVLHCGVWDPACQTVRESCDPTISETFRIWGYELSWGSFAEFAKVKDFQCMPRPKHLTWEESAVGTLVGSTAYRMLTHWQPHQVKPGDPVLIYGGAGGLGSMAIQITKALGGVPIAVVSSEEKKAHCRRLGAAVCLNRNDYTHWGPVPSQDDKGKYDEWNQSLRSFGKAIHTGLGERRNPRIVFEHSGSDTFPTSLWVCDTNGMVVTCGATSGYMTDFDIRYLWMRQKRVQGSHFASGEEALAFNQMVIDGKIDPCLARTFRFEEVPLAHQMLKENRLTGGKIAISIGSLASN